MSTNRFEDDIRQAEERFRARKATRQEADAELDAFCLELCRLYPTLSEEEQGDLRTSVARYEAVRWGVFGWITGVTDRIRTAADAAWLDVGLAAAALENCAVDDRDWLLSVAFLYAAGEDVGVDLRPHFQHYGDLASRKLPTGGWTPVSAMLTDFHNYAVLGDGRKFYRRWRAKHPLNEAGAGD